MSPEFIAALVGMAFASLVAFYWELQTTKYRKLWMASLVEHNEKKADADYWNKAYYSLQNDWNSIAQASYDLETANAELQTKVHCGDYHCHECAGCLKRQLEQTRAEMELVKENLDALRDRIPWALSVRDAAIETSKELERLLHLARAHVPEGADDGHWHERTAGVLENRFKMLPEPTPNEAFRAGRQAEIDAELAANPMLVVDTQTGEVTRLDGMKV